jgi:NADP-dependent 3-hydroxy acid dehydrogenase YdfG
MPFPTPTTYHHSPTSATDPTQTRLSVSGKAVLVTGGGTTIGKAIVEAFAKAKAKTVFLTGRRIHLLEEVAKKVLNSALIASSLQR